MRRKIFNKITSILTFIFALISSITFWVFIYMGDVFDHWYPLVGMFVASHGALIGITFWEYLDSKNRSISEQWYIWFKKRHK